MVWRNGSNGRRTACDVRPARRSFQRSLLTLIAVTGLFGCVPKLLREQRQLALPPMNSEVKAAQALLQSSQPLSIRGASADEQPGTDAWRRRAVANTLLTSYLRVREAPLYRKRDPAIGEDGLPRYCIALSGGGMRALAFGTGVLHGLQERSRYDRVTVLSAVSGGGYASYWIAGHVWQGAAEAQLLSGSNAAPLDHLRQHASELVSPTTKAGLLLFPFDSPPASSNRYGSGNDRNVLQSFAGDLLENLFSGEVTQMNWGPGHLGYVWALERMLVGAWEAPVSAKRLYKLVAAGRVPLPVWVATARPSDAPGCVGLGPGKELAEHARPLSYAVFEMAPTRMGSEELGFLSHMLVGPLDATALSGAGMAVPYNERCGLFRMVDASVTVANYPARPDPVESQHRTQGPSTGQSFRLTDGGVADNLAVFPLVRRLCSDITVVDAEFDPYLVFAGYGYLKQQLARLDVRLDIPGVETVAARNRIPALPPDPEVPCDDGICLIRPRPECVRRESSADCVSSDHLPTAVFEGELGPIPFATMSSSTTGDQQWDYADRVSAIHYIKLSLDAVYVDQYPKTVRDRYASHADRRLVGSAPCVATLDNRACSFPHESTANLDYGEGEFEAYWDLGRCIVERNWPDPTADGPTGPCGDSNWSALTAH